MISVITSRGTMSGGFSGKPTSHAIQSITCWECNNMTCPLLSRSPLHANGNKCNEIDDSMIMECPLSRDCCVETVLSPWPLHADGDKCSEIDDFVIRECPYHVIVVPRLSCVDHHCMLTGDKCSEFDASMIKECPYHAIIVHLNVMPLGLELKITLSHHQT